MSCSRIMPSKLPKLEVLNQKEVMNQHLCMYVQTVHDHYVACDNEMSGDGALAGAAAAGGPAVRLRGAAPHGERVHRRLDTAIWTRWRRRCGSALEVQRRRPCRPGRACLQHSAAHCLLQTSIALPAGVAAALVRRRQYLHRRFCRSRRLRERMYFPMDAPIPQAHTPKPPVVFYPCCALTCSAGAAA